MKLALVALALSIATIAVQGIAIADALSKSDINDFLDSINVDRIEDKSLGITKGKAIEMIAKNAGVVAVPDPDAINPYSDVPKDASYEPYVRKLYELGALPRVTKHSNTFHPNAKIKLVHFLTILFYVEGIPVPRVVKEDLQIRDIRSDSYLAPIFYKAQQLGLVVVPKQSMVRPYHTVNYEEAVEILKALNSPAASTGVSKDFYESSDMAYFQEVSQTVLQKYLHRRDLSAEDTRRMIYGALEGFVDGLEDPYSIFLPPLKNTNLQERLNGEFEGIGAYIGQGSSGRITITGTLKNSPAEKAGLITNDVILRIDGTSTAQMGLVEAIAHIKGPEGTKVTLTIERIDDGTEKVFDVDVTRATIIIETIEKEIFERNGKRILYLRIYEFGGKTNSEFREIAKEIVDVDKPDGIVLDLRGNPGGFLDGSVNILGYFVKPGENVVSVRYLDYITPRVLKNNADILRKFPLVILINGGTASAGEIVAGALSETNKTPLVGTTTFGKGTVQEIISYDGGASLKLTVAEYTLPSGKSINGVGIQPDVKAEDDPDTEVDEALEEALDEIRKQL